MQIKKILKILGLYFYLRATIFQLRSRYDVIGWRLRNMQGIPPHIIKQKMLKDLRRKHNLDILVETGTCFGDMVNALNKHFNLIYSIELSEYLYDFVKERFKGNPKVKLINGDSGKILKEVVSKVDNPALFWLDGHYSAGVTAKGDKNSPIIEELTTIFNSKVYNHVIVIDDARCFGKEESYPPLDTLYEFIYKYKPDASISVKNDSIIVEL